MAIIIAILVVVGLVGLGGEERGGRHTPSTRLDVDAFRAQQAARLANAKHLAARAKPAKSPKVSNATPKTGAWAQQGLGALPTVGNGLTTPCILGPAALCGARAVDRRLRRR